MIEEKLVLRGRLHHLSYQQGRQPTAARAIVTGLRYIESNPDAVPLHQSLFPVLKFVPNGISHQSAQGPYQVPLQAPIPARRSFNRLLNQSAGEPEFLLSR